MTLLSSATISAGEAIADIGRMFSGTNIQTENKKYTAEDLMKLKEGIKKMKEEMKSDQNVNASIKASSQFLKELSHGLVYQGDLRNTLSRPDIVSRDTLYLAANSTSSSSGQDGRPGVFASDSYPEGEFG